MALDNISDRIRRVRATRFVEAEEVASQEWVCRVPAYALIEEILLYAEEAWEDDVSATLDVGIRSYEWDPLQSQYVVADGYVPGNVVSGMDLIAGPEVDFVSFPVMDISDQYRDIVATVTTDETDGESGRTVLIVTYVQPVFEAPTIQID